MLRARLHRLIVLCAVLFGALNATAGHGHHVRMADPALQSFFATGGTMEDLCGEGAEQVGPDCPACLLSKALDIGGATQPAVPVRQVARIARPVAADVVPARPCLRPRSRAPPLPV
ncbi:MAG: hypothetical protein AAGK98_12975 [Pseudomonadota bacterium]